MENEAFVKSLAKLVKYIFCGRSVITDDFIFRLHYKFTFRALLLASALVFCYQFFFTSVKCISKSDFIGQYVLNDYCKFAGTFTFPDSFSKKVGQEIPYPGIDKYRPGQDRMKHTYYPFVCYVLFLQALLFRLPHLLWRKCEAGRMEALVEKLENPALAEDETLRKCLATEFNDRKNRHQCYALTFLFCEVLNFVSVICQIDLLNKFLGGQFSNFGADVVRYVYDEQKDNVDPRVRLFPLMTSCTFNVFGSSGDVQRHNALCVMTLNPIHEKIFFMMWFWLVILSVMSGCVLIYRMIVLSSKQVRLRLLNVVSSLSSRHIINFVVPTLSYGEWFSLYLLADNIDNIHYKPFIQQLKDSRTNKNAHDSGDFDDLKVMDSEQ